MKHFFALLYLFSSLAAANDAEPIANEIENKVIDAITTAIKR